MADVDGYAEGPADAGGGATRRWPGGERRWRRRRDVVAVAAGREGAGVARGVDRARFDRVRRLAEPTDGEHVRRFTRHQAGERRAVAQHPALHEVLVVPRPDDLVVV